MFQIARQTSFAACSARRFVTGEPLSFMRSASYVPQRREEIQEDEEIAEIYKYLKTFPGGSVDLDLSKLDSHKVAKICVNQPSKRNAFSGVMFCDLLDAVKTLQNPAVASKCSAVLLLGRGGTFCSGADLNYVRPSMNTEGGWRMSRIMQHTLCRFKTLPFLSVALLEGFAVCGGAELAAWTDLRIADQTSKIIFVQARRNVTTAWGGTLRVAQILGPRRALQVLLPGRVLTANSARELGFVDVVLPAPKNVPKNPQQQTETEVAATEWLAELCSYTEPSVVQGFKRSLNFFQSNSAAPMQDLLAFERGEFLRVWATPQHIAKFNEQFKVKKT